MSANLPPELLQQFRAMTAAREALAQAETTERKKYAAWAAWTEAEASGPLPPYEVSPFDEMTAARAALRAAIDCFTAANRRFMESSARYVARLATLESEVSP